MSSGCLDRVSHPIARTAYLQRVDVRLFHDAPHVQPVERPQVDPPPPLGLEGEGRRPALPAAAANRTRMG